MSLQFVHKYISEMKENNDDRFACWIRRKKQTFPYEFFSSDIFTSEENFFSEKWEKNGSAENR